MPRGASVRNLRIALHPCCASGHTDAVARLPERGEGPSIARAHGRRGVGGCRHCGPPLISRRGGFRDSRMLRRMSDAVLELGTRAKRASRVLATAGTEAKNAGLLAAADLLLEQAGEILAANAADLDAATAGGM